MKVLLAICLMGLLVSVLYLLVGLVALAKVLFRGDDEAPSYLDEDWDA